MATIALAATDGMLQFELALACEVFVRDPSGLADPWYDLVVCGESPVRIGRFRMEPDDGLDRLARADTVIIPAVEDIDADVPPDLLDAVRAAHNTGARIWHRGRRLQLAAPPTGRPVLAIPGHRYRHLRRPRRGVAGSGRAGHPPDCLTTARQSEALGRATGGPLSAASRVGRRQRVTRRG